MQKIKSNIKVKLENLGTNFWMLGTFLLLLTVYLFAKTLNIMILFFKTRNYNLILKATRRPTFQKIVMRFVYYYNLLISYLEQGRIGTISRVDLIELALRNMKSKKVRTFITIGGMTIGIGAIVFLVSIGYGFEKLVVTRVARLDEMRQVDVSSQAGGKVKINDKTLANFKDIQNVESALPLIAVVGRVSYLNSVTDMAVYGVTTDYLKQSAIKPVTGKVFDSNKLSLKVSNQIGEVAGVSTERRTGAEGEYIQDLDFKIDIGTWIRVRANPSINAQIIGYTKRVEGNSFGKEFWGGAYDSDNEAGSFGKTKDGKTIGKWIKSEVLIWKQVTCEPVTQGDCEGGKYLVARDENNRQLQETGYFAEIGIKISGLNVLEPKVLGVSTEAPTNVRVDWVEIASEAGVIKPLESKSVVLPTTTKKHAVVNRAMLSVLGIKETEALNKKFKTIFVVVGDLLSDPTINVESTQTEYTIVGVTPEEKTPVFYVPFTDLRSLGITNFSQVKVVVRNQNELYKTRRQIESMGYATRSVADTVAQINSLFATARTILMLLGMVALAVASLGMFNTLTISLLERTREVGLMKAMGMKSSEVQELFLTESIIMGFFGGIMGIVVGWILGKIVSITLSFFAIFKGVGFVDVSYIPLPFIAVIVFLSILVGLLTGFYPAKRATRISALDALRYE